LRGFGLKSKKGWSETKNPQGGKRDRRKGMEEKKLNKIFRIEKGTRGGSSK